MANTFKLKRSAVEGKVPSTTDLELGELGLNTYDGKLYAKKDNGTASIVEIGATEADFLSTKRVISDDYTLSSGRNMLSINDVEVSTGTTVEIPAGSTWIVVS